MFTSYLKQNGDETNLAEYVVRIRQSGIKSKQIIPAPKRWCGFLAILSLVTTLTNPATKSALDI